MSQSPFAYFRGTTLTQAHDLKGTPASGINVRACGNCHLMNFGGFATPERTLVTKSRLVIWRLVFFKVGLDSGERFGPGQEFPRIVDQPPLLYHVDERNLNESGIAATLKRYRALRQEFRRMLFDRFKFVDMAIKVVGVGSVGTRCFVALFSCRPRRSLVPAA
jgi:uncharacterized protein (DUF2252 family)